MLQRWALSAEVPESVCVVQIDKYTLQCTDADYIPLSLSILYPTDLTTERIIRGNFIYRWPLNLDVLPNNQVLVAPGRVRSLTAE